jgi:ABC-type microcin C transport system permease subunit YejB
MTSGDAVSSMFASDAEKAFETMALAYHEKTKWDLRWFRLRIVAYSVGSFLIGIILVSLFDLFFDFNIIRWLFNIGQ